MEICKTKTDLIDAAIIADMLRIHEPPVTTAKSNRSSLFDTCSGSGYI